MSVNRKPDDRILTAELFAQVLVHHPFILNLKGMSRERTDFCQLLFSVKAALESYVEECFMEGVNRG
jgi:hypothetical protein